MAFNHVFVEGPSLWQTSIWVKCVLSSIDYDGTNLAY